MATDAENIAAIKRDTLQELADIAAGAVATPPDKYVTYNENGRSFDWNGYKRELRETVAWCDAQLAATEPFESVSQGYSPSGRC